MSDDTSVLPALPAQRAGGRSFLTPILALVAIGGLAGTGVFYSRLEATETALAEANANATSLQSRISKAREDATKAEATIAQLNAEILKLKDAPLPVDITFRMGPPNAGLIARIENASLEPMTVSVAVTRPSTGESRELTVEAPVRGIAEVGATEGWHFQSGDVLTLSSGSYKPLQFRTP